MILEWDLQQRKLQACITIILSTNERFKLLLFAHGSRCVSTITSYDFARISTGRTIVFSSLVYVVCRTHADCQVVLAFTNGKTALARPHYNKFNMLCCSLYESVKGDSSGVVVVSFPSSLWRESPVGLRFAVPRAIGTMADWRLRSRDSNTDDDCDSGRNRGVGRR